MTANPPLAHFGWRPFFAQQLAPDESLTPARVCEQHRGHFQLFTSAGDVRLPITPDLPTLTVGDWILLDGGHCVRRLERFSHFARQEAGTSGQNQSIAANVDTVFLVTSANADFNLNRLERYLALVRTAGAWPVVVITKIDTCNDVESYRQAAQSLDPALSVEPVNALEGASIESLRSWLGTDQTVALLGSSGVGKSTLVNGLLERSEQATAAIRDDDAKGRHTTTYRSLHLIPGGGVLLDTPGMRELKLTASTDLASAFDDIHALAQACRFADCAHAAEPGCAVIAATERGELEPRRLDSYRKLQRELQYQQETEAQRRSRNRNLQRHYHSVQKAKPR